MKIIITEEQYRLLKENDESSYESVVDLLLNSDRSNRELGFYLIKSQGLDLDKISNLLLKSKGVNSAEDLVEKLKGIFGIASVGFAFIKYVPLMKLNVKTNPSIATLNVDISLNSKSFENYSDSVIIGTTNPKINISTEDEQYMFLKNCLNKFKDTLKIALQLELDRLPSEEIFEHYKILNEEFSKEDNEYQNLMRLASSGDIDSIKMALMISYNYDTETQNKVLNYWLNYLNQTSGIDWIDRTEIIPFGETIDWIPDTIVNLSKAKNITFDYQDITELPDNFGKLVNLEELRLKNNLIEELPESFSELSNLHYLDLSNNNISIFPEAIGGLKKLSFLNLMGNKIQYVPEFLSELPNLKYLILSENNLSNDEKYKIKSMLPHVKNLALWFNNN